jgi:hypothetical protein
MDSDFFYSLNNESSPLNVFRARDFVQFGWGGNTGDWDSSKKVIAASSEELTKFLFAEEIEFTHFLQDVWHVLF